MFSFEKKMTVVFNHMKYGRRTERNHPGPHPGAGLRNPQNAQ
jgi:hypothetical protein